MTQQLTRFGLFLPVCSSTDKATAEELPLGGENLELNFEISDAIRSKTVVAKDAMRSIKRRLNHKNPNVQLLALSVCQPISLNDIAIPKCVPDSWRTPVSRMEAIISSLR